MNNNTTLPMATCQWIEPTDPHSTMGCCSGARVEGRKYCEQHVFRMYQKGSRLARRKKDIRTAEAIWSLASEIDAAVKELMEEGYDF